MRRLFLASLSLVLAGCTASLSTEPAAPGASSTSSAPSESSQLPTTPTPTAPPVSFTLVSAGDILPHPSVYNAARRGKTYDFKDQFAATRDFTERADLALCSLEVPIAPPGTQPTGYPVFGAPRELVTNLKELGWDGCTIATNHSADRGLAGVKATVAAFREEGLGYTGTGRSDEERATVQTYTVKKDGRSVVVAHVSGTYGLNGIPDPGGQNFRAVNTLDDMIEAAKRAREDGADMVVASPHWGVEYQDSPNEEQRQVAKKLVDSGNVDVIIGTHSHVPQPMDELTAPDGRVVPIIYSTGNFIAGQDEDCCPPNTASGALVVVNFTASDDGVKVEGMKAVPVMIDREAGRRQYLLQAVHDGQRPEKMTISAARVKDRWDRFTRVIPPDHLISEIAEGGAQVEVGARPDVP